MNCAPTRYDWSTGFPRPLPRKAPRRRFPLSSVLLLIGLVLVATTCAAAGERRLRLTESRVDGRNRICIYNDLGHDYVVTIPSSRLCERWIFKEDE